MTARQPPADTERGEEFAPAKINLWLHVTGRRGDGYHELDSLVAFADVGDLLTVEAAPGLALTVGGPFAAGLADTEDNLVLGAANLLYAYAGGEAGAAIVLHKNLPLASGIGGGSADAAAALRALIRLWSPAIDTAALEDLALRLGADVPVCLQGATALMTGIGEIVQPVGAGWPALPAVLVNPGVPVSTSEVFRALNGAFSEPARSLDTPVRAADALSVLKDTRNDLEAPAIAIAPAIGDVLAALHGCPGVQLARMSGSGATCFALFATAEDARAAAALLKMKNAAWWVTDCVIGGHLPGGH